MKKIMVCCLLTMIFVLTGCSTNSAADGSLSTDSTDNNKQAVESFTLDNYSRTVTIDHVPEKVVTAGPNCSELFVALGIEDYIVGNCADNHSQGPLPEYAEGYAKIPELNYGYPTLESVVSSGADFFYGIDWIFSGDFTVEALESYGITVYVCAATNYEEIWQEINDIGRIFGVEDRAAEFIEQEQNRVAAVEQKVAGQTPLKVLVYDAGGDTIYTAGGNNLETLFIETAGGVNIFSELDKAWTGVSFEEVLAREPDVIIVHDYDTPSAAEKIATIKADPLLSQLECVQNDRFVVLSLECAFPGSRTGYCVETLAKGFFPELF